MRLALDSNVLIYAEGGNDAKRRETAHSVVGGVLPSRILVPLQSAAETFNWLVRKGGMDRAAASNRTLWWLEKFSTQDTNREVITSAAELVVTHRLQIFDAIILAAAATGGASVLLSEDMQDGFRWRGVTVANPFAAEPSGIIQSIFRNLTI